MKIKIFILFSLLIIVISPVYSQRKFQKMDSDKQQKDDAANKNEFQPWWQKVKYGGAVSAMFGTYTYFYLQPWVGYKVNDRFMPGAGITYIYQSVNVPSTAGQYTVSDNAYGFNLFAKEQLFGNVALFAEYAPINFTSYDGYYYDPPKRVWGNQFFVGGGAFQKNFYFLVLYDLLWKAYDVNANLSTYSTTFRTTPLDIRVGFVF